MLLHTSIGALKGVGKTLEGRLSILGIQTVSDLLFHFPFRYEDFSQVSSISGLQAGQEITIEAIIELIHNKRTSRKRKIITEAIVSDFTGQVRIVWFGQAFITKNLKVGDKVKFSGKIKEDMFGLQLVSPVYEKVKEKDELIQAGRILPVYPLTSGITQKQLRHLLSQIIGLAKKVEEWIPEDIRDRADIMTLSEALTLIHFPNSFDEIEHAQRRLKFDELFILQLRAELLRQSLHTLTAPQIPFHEKEVQQFVKKLPFELTKDQKIASWEILQDLEKETPMNRLIEGDVGSGKTVVAALVMYNTAVSRLQALIMAPTEILAKQHYASLRSLFPKEIKVGILTRTEVNTEKLEGEKNSKTKQKREILKMIQDGSLDIIVGTHAILSDSVNFHNLGLVIVDEQHRFGVEQRKMLKDKAVHQKTTPHFLSMTATPIPRSFALTLYGDLDLSLIKTKPSGRKPIKTRFVAPHHRQKAYDFINEEVKRGRQVFVICPQIGDQNIESSSLQDEKKTVLEEYEKLSKHIFPHLRIGYLHGKLKGEEKDRTMKDFTDGKTDILVSTSVVEVGVDIKNASVMMIEGAERFGLAQLHQFRGRVGRSDHQSYCFVLSTVESENVNERLQFFERTSDGFALAEYDLQLRGPGEVYGKQQSGMMQFKIATMRDVEIIKLAREIAKNIDFQKYPQLREKIHIWEKKVHLE